MPRNSSGVYTRKNPPGSTGYVSGTVIDPNIVNGEINDIGTEISNSIAANGTTTITANIPMAGYKLTGLTQGSTSGDSVEYLQSGSLAQAQTFTGFVTGGTSGAFTLTPTPAIGALIAGQRFNVKFSAAGNGSDTLAVSGLAATALKQFDYQGNLVAPVIASGQLADIQYNGTYWVILNQLPVIGITGEIRMFGLLSAPAGWLQCPTSATTSNGVSRTTYAALFTALGGATSPWGVNPGVSTGDGSTTFNLPWTVAGGVFRNGGSVGAFDAGTVKSHSHTLNTLSNQGNGVSVSGGGFIVNSASSGLATDLTGGTNNIPAGANALVCVKT